MASAHKSVFVFDQLTLLFAHATNLVFLYSLAFIELCFLCNFGNNCFRCRHSFSATSPGKMIVFLSPSAKKEIYPREMRYPLLSANLDRQKLSLLFHQVVWVRGQNVRKLQWKLCQRNRCCQTTRRQVTEY